MHPEAPHNVSLRLDQVAAAVRRRWPTALVVLACWLAIGAGAAQLVPTGYDATATVTVESFADPSAGGPAATAPDMPTEQQAATGTAILERAAAELGTTQAEVARSISVANPERSRVLSFTYEAPTGAQAARGANTVAAEYLKTRRAAARDQTEVEVTAVQKRLARVRGRLPKSAANPLASAYGAQVADLEGRLADLAVAADAAGGHVTAEAVPARTPSGPSTAVYLAGALVLGLGCAVVAALARDRLSRRAVDPGLLSSRIGAPVVVAARNSSADDVVRTLALRFDLDERPTPQTIAVVGAPSAVLARALSAQLRRQGLRTELADAASVGQRNVDRGWPRAATDRVLVVDIDRDVDGPLAATVAGRCDLVVLAVTKGSSTARADAFVALLHATGRRVDGAVLLRRDHPLSTIPEAGPEWPPHVEDHHRPETAQVVDERLT